MYDTQPADGAKSSILATRVSDGLCRDSFRLSWPYKVGDSPEARWLRSTSASDFMAESFNWAFLHGIALRTLSIAYQ